MEIIKKKAIKLVPKEYDEIYYQTRDNEIFLVKDEALAHELELDERDSFLDSISFVENKKTQ